MKKTNILVTIMLLLIPTVYITKNSCTQINFNNNSLLKRTKYSNIVPEGTEAEFNPGIQEEETIAAGFNRDYQAMERAHRIRSFEIEQKYKSVKKNEQKAIKELRWAKVKCGLKLLVFGLSYYCCLQICKKES